MEDGSGVRTRTWTVRRPPLSPPAGVAPFAGAGSACSLPLLGGFAVGPANLFCPGAEPPEPPRSPGARWARAVARAVARAGRALGATGGCRVVSSGDCGGRSLGVHTFHFTDSNGDRY